MAVWLFWITRFKYDTLFGVIDMVRMAEWSKALRSGRILQL